MKSKHIQLKDSVARDHLANERTFLAWIRTGFATAALGMVLARFQDVSQFQQQQSTSIRDGNKMVFEKILALSFILFGALCVIAGTFRFIKVEKGMEKDIYPTSGYVSALVAACGMAGFVATFVLLLI